MDGDIIWDDEPADLSDEAPFHAPGKAILTKNLRTFRNGNCYVGANALQVVWMSRSELRAAEIFNPKVIVCVPQNYVYPVSA